MKKKVANLCFLIRLNLQLFYSIAAVFTLTKVSDFSRIPFARRKGNYDMSSVSNNVTLCIAENLDHPLSTDEVFFQVELKECDHAGGVKLPRFGLGG